MLLGLFIIAIFGFVIFLIAMGKAPTLLRPFRSSEVVAVLSNTGGPNRIFSGSFRSDLVICSMMIFVSPLFQYLGTASFDCQGLQWLEMIPLLLLVSTIPISFFLLFLILIPRYRVFAVRNVIASGVLWAAASIGYPIGNQIRTDAFYRLAERSQPLVDAIRSYEALYGKAPPELNALVPQFLPSIPDTGMGAYPHYEYHVGEEATSKYNGNPWSLVVFTPSVGINFDIFLYLPLGNYPEFGYGGFLERIRDWAYVHE